MPYIHRRCGGEIRYFPPKCRKCNRRWSPLALLALAPPKDMHYELPEARRGGTSHAKWAEKAPPGTAWIASRLPNWPRWARILSVIVLVGVIAIVIIFVVM